MEPYIEFRGTLQNRGFWLVKVGTKEQLPITLVTGLLGIAQHQKLPHNSAADIARGSQRLARLFLPGQRTYGLCGQHAFRAVTMMTWDGRSLKIV